MEFGDRLIRGEIVKSYKSLFWTLSSERAASCPCLSGTGLYAESLCAGNRNLGRQNRDQRRRLRYECQIVNSGGGLIMVNPNHVDALFTEAFEKV